MRLFAPGPPHFAGRAIFRGPPRIPEQGAGIKSAVSYSPDLLIDPLLLLRRFMPLCTTLCRRGAPPRGPILFHYLSKCSLSYISISLYFALYAALLLSHLFSVLFALLLSPPLFIPLYAASHRFSWFLFLFFCVCVLVHHAQSLAKSIFQKHIA